MKRIYIFLPLLAILLCSCHNENKGEIDTKTVFRYNESAGISSLDPSFARNVENIWAIHQLYNGLVQMNDELDVEPCIAKSWEISEDGLNYTFHLRDDVYFHDHELFPNGQGRKVIAEDFKHSLFRIMNPEVTSPGAWIFNNIDLSRHLGFHATDDTTFQIFLIKPFPPFLGLLTMQYCSVIPHEIVEHYGRDFRNHPIGTGPFVFKMWKEGVKLIFVKNENYFEKDTDGSKLPYLDAVSISFINEKQVVFLEFIKGDLDLISGLDEMPKDEVLSQTGKLNPKYQNKFRLESQPYLKTDYLGILVDEESEIVKDNPLRLKAVRQALNYGIDKEKMITYLRNNIGTAARAGIIPKGMPSYDEKKVKGYEYNPDKALALLTEAGFTEGGGMLEIVINTSSDHLDMCEFIQHQLGEIGIDVKIDVKAAVTLRELVAKSKLNLFRKNWLADYPDAENYLALFYSKNFCPIGPNYTHFKNDKFDRLYEKAQTITDDMERYELYQEMDRIIIEAAPIIPLYYDQIIRLVQNNIIGLSNNPMNLLELKRVKKINDQPS